MRPSTLVPLRVWKRSIRWGRQRKGTRCGNATASWMLIVFRWKRARKNVLRSQTARIANELAVLMRITTAWKTRNVRRRKWISWQNAQNCSRWRSVRNSAYVVRNGCLVWLLVDRYGTANATVLTSCTASAFARMLITWNAVGRTSGAPGKSWRKDVSDASRGEGATDADDAKSRKGKTEFYFISNLINVYSTHGKSNFVRKKRLHLS